MIRGGNDLQRSRRERRVHATRPGGRGHARLEFSEKLVQCGTRYGVPTRVTKMRGASAHRDRRPRPSGRLPATLTEAQLDGLSLHPLGCGSTAAAARPAWGWRWPSLWRLRRAFARAVLLVSRPVRRLDGSRAVLLR